MANSPKAVNQLRCPHCEYELTSNYCKNCGTEYEVERTENILEFKRKLATIPIRTGVRRPLCIYESPIISLVFFTKTLSSSKIVQRLIGCEGSSFCFEYRSERDALRPILREKFSKTYGVEHINLQESVDNRYLSYSTKYFSRVVSVYYAGVLNEQSGARIISMDWVLPDRDGFGESNPHEYLLKKQLLDGRAGNSTAWKCIGGLLQFTAKQEYEILNCKDELEKMSQFDLRIRDSILSFILGQ